MKQQNIIPKLEKNLKIRKQKIRRRLTGTPEVPRVSLFRSNSQIFGQVIDDSNSKTLVSISSLEKDLKKNSINVDRAKELGKILGERASKSGITKIIFDRNGRRYHGRVKSFADGLREAGLNF